MKQVSMLAFRLHADQVLAQVQKGQRVILTKRGKPVARLEPIVDTNASPEDPFFTLADMSVPGSSLTNKQIDGIVYGE